MNNSNQQSSRASIFLHLGCLLFLATIIAAAYANSFRAPFTFDDFRNIVDNPHIQIKSLSMNNLIEAANNGPSSHRWLPNITFALNYYSGGMNVWGYHLVNLLIHIAAAMVFYFLTFKTLQLLDQEERIRFKGEIALSAALLWALHPVQLNAVTYIVQRMASMAGFLYFSAVLCFVYGRLAEAKSSKKHLFYGGSIVSGLCAVFCKENAVMLPAILMGYEFLILRQKDRSAAKKRLALWAAGVGLVLVSFSLLFMGQNALSGLIDGYASREFTMGERLLTQSRILFFYLSLLFLPLPSRLNLLHDFPLSTSLLSPPQTILAVIGLITLIGAVFFCRRERLFSFALFWFLANLVIESTIIPLELVYEHRLYIPSAFLFLLLSTYIYKKLWARMEMARGTAVLAIALLAVVTWQRNSVWQSEIFLWNEVIQKSPGLVRPYGNLGRALEEQGRFKEAEELYRKSLAVDKAKGDRKFSAVRKFNLGKVHYNLGVIYRKQGRYVEAMRESQLALHLDPGRTDAILTMAIAYEKMGLHEEALAKFKEASAKGMRSANFYNNLAITYYSMDLVDRAIEMLQRALELEAEHAEAHYNLGIAFSAKGMYEEARREMALSMQLRNKMK